MTMADKRRQELAAGKGGNKPPAVKAPAAPVKPQDAPQSPPEPVKVAFTPPPAPSPCGACGSALKIIKVNSRVRAWACVKIGCKLYRERIKVFSIPAPKPAPSKSKGDKGAKDNDKGRKK